MQLFQIDDPSSKDDINSEIVVGIDFGTTHSLVAYSIDNRFDIIPDDTGRILIPSTVCYENGQFLVGRARDNQNTVYSIKRLMGKNYTEISKMPYACNVIDIIQADGNIAKFKFGEQYLTVPEVASKIFQFLKSQAEQYLNQSITKAVVTIPAYFDNAAKGEVILAAKIAGIEVIRLMVEPTAAAYSYGLYNNVTGCYVVYDFGGGTFDVSVLNIQNKIFQVLGVSGDHELGGDDIDSLLANYLISQYALDTLIPGNRAQIYQIAKTIKETLTTKLWCEFEIQERIVRVTQDQFENLIHPLIDSTIAIISSLFIDLDLEHNNVDGILLVGGSSQIPLIQKLIQNAFNIPIIKSSETSAETSVVSGAALQANNLMSKNAQNLIIDVLPLSLGLELYGGLVEKIILRNTPIPFSICKEFTTYADYQNGMQFHILQGERELSKDCRSLARFEFTDLPAMKAGHIKVEVNFAIDANGILSVSVFEKVTAKYHSIELNPSFGLTNGQIQKIIDESYEYAYADINSKKLNEIKIKSNKLLDAIKPFIAKLTDSQFIQEHLNNNQTLDLSEKYIQNLLSLYNQLTITIQSDDYDSIYDTFSSLQQKFSVLGEKIVNLELAKALKGQSI